MSVRKTKKTIKKNPLGSMFFEHIMFWVLDSVNPKNEYRGISRMLKDFCVSELSKITGISKKKLNKYIVTVI